MLIAHCLRPVLTGLFLLVTLLVAGLAAVTGQAGPVVGVALMLATLGTVAWLSRWAASAGSLLAVFAAALAGWTYWYSSHQLSDFGVYYRCGTDYVQQWHSAKGWTEACSGAYLPGFSSYWRRSLLYSLPIGWLTGGGSYVAFKVANALAHLLAVLLLYRGVTGVLGRRAGLLAASALAVYPEFWFATSLATSDNFAVPVLVALLLLLARLDNAQTRQPWTIAGVAALVLALDMLRSIGPILIVALLFAALCAPRAGRGRLLAATVVSAAAVYAAGALPALFGISVVQTNGVLAAIIGNGLAGPRSWVEAYTWHQYVLPLLSQDERSYLMTGLVAQDMLSAWTAPSYWLDKLRILFAGDGYYGYSTAISSGGNPDDFVLPGLGASLLAYSPFWAAAMRGAVALLCLTAGVGALRMARYPLARASISLATALVLYILLIGEVQPRYSVLVAPALAVAAAGVLVPAQTVARTLGLHALGSSVACLAAVLLGLAVAWGIGNGYAARAPKLVWQTADRAVRIDCTPGPAAPQVMHRRVLLPLAEKGCYVLHARLDGRLQGDLKFLLVREPMAPRWSREAHQPLALRLTVRDETGAVLREQRLTLEADATVLPVMIRAAGLATLDVVVSGNGEPGGAASLAYFHDRVRAAINLPAP